jgi:metaxin
MAAPAVALADDALSLTCFGPAWGLPSLSPECTHAIAYLHFFGLRAPDDFSLLEAVSAKLSPRAELPELASGVGRSCGNSHEFFDLLATLGYDLDASLGLSARERADAAAYASLVTDALAPALLHAFWLDTDNYKVVQPAYAARLPFPLSIYHPWQIQRRTYAFLARRGLARPADSHAGAVRALDALSVRLGALPYFAGERPGSLDAVAFAYLVTIQRAPLPSDALRRALSAHANLGALCDRIMSSHFSDAATLVRLRRTQPEARASAVGGGDVPSSAPIGEAASKRLRERQRSRRFTMFALSSFVAYVVSAYLPAILSAVLAAAGDDDNDDDDEGNDDDDDE